MKEHHVGCITNICYICVWQSIHVLTTLITTTRQHSPCGQHSLILALRNGGYQVFETISFHRHTFKPLANYIGDAWALFFSHIQVTVPLSTKHVYSVIRSSVLTQIMMMILMPPNSMTNYGFLATIDGTTTSY